MKLILLFIESMSLPYQVSQCSYVLNWNGRFNVKFWKLAFNANLNRTSLSHFSRFSTVFCWFQISCWVPLNAASWPTTSFLAIAVAENVSNVLMRNFDLQNSLLIVFAGIPRSIKDPSERWLDPSHPLRIEIRPSKLLIFNGVVSNRIVKSLVEEHAFFIKLSFNLAHFLFHLLVQFLFLG